MYDVWVMGNVLVWMVRIWDIIYRTRVGIGIVLIWLVLLEDLCNGKKEYTTNIINEKEKGFLDIIVGEKVN